MHASERDLNATRTMRAFLEGLTVTGTPEFRYQGDPRKAPSTAWVRVSFDYPGGSEAGRIDGNNATQAAVALTLDLFYPTLEDGVATSIDTLPGAVDDLTHAFRHRMLDLSDYSVDPSSPSVVSGYPVRFPFEPAKTPIPAEDGWLRIRLTFRGYRYLQHAA